MSSQVINRDGSQPEIGSSGSVSAADEEFHTGRSFIQELARQLRHEFETLQAEDQRRKDLDALRAEDRRQQEISQRWCMLKSNASLNILIGLPAS